MTIAVDDTTIGTSPDATQELTLAITDVNEPPSFALTTLIAALAEDPDTSDALRMVDLGVQDDALGSLTFSLSGADAALFDVTSAGLFLRAGTSLDFETAPELNLTVQVDDPTIGATPDAAAPLTLTITDMPEAPLAADDKLATSEFLVNARQSAHRITRPSPRWQMGVWCSPGVRHKVSKTQKAGQGSRHVC